MEEKEECEAAAKRCITLTHPLFGVRSAISDIISVYGASCLMNAPGSRTGRGLPWCGSLVRKRWRCLFTLVESEAKWGNKMGERLPQCSFPRSNADPGRGAGAGGGGRSGTNQLKPRKRAGGLEGKQPSF